MPLATPTSFDVFAEMDGLIAEAKDVSDRILAVFARKEAVMVMIEDTGVAYEMGDATLPLRQLGTALTRRLTQIQDMATNLERMTDPAEIQVVR